MPPSWPSWRLRLLAQLSRLVFGLAILFWVGLLVGWGALQWWIVPRADAWRPALQAVATRALGVPVSIGRIEARADWATVALTLHDVRLLDPEGRTALQLPRVGADVSVRSLWQLGLDRLTIEAPEMEVRRLGDGRLRVAGLDLNSAPQADSAVADWFFDQREFVLRGGRLHWIDETRPQAPVLTLEAVELLVRNPGLRHEWRLDATLPPHWGERISVRGRFTRPFWQTHPGRWRDWSGELFLQAPWLDMAELGRYVDVASAWGVRAVQAQGALRLWAQVQRGALPALTADLHWRNVRLDWIAAAQAPEPLALSRIEGRLVWQRKGDTSTLGSDDLVLEVAEGARWLGGRWRLDATSGPDGHWRAWALSADRLDLGALQRLARGLPLGHQVNAWARETQPVGELEGVELRWTAAQAGQPERWSARGRVRDLGLRAGEATPPTPDGSSAPGRPGLQGVDAEFAFDERGGRATVMLRHGALVFPGVFEEPRLVFDELQADVRWRVNANTIEVELPRLRFANADAAGSGRARWRTADPAASRARDRWPGVLDLELQLTRANAARVARYLPLTVNADARRYVQAAVRSGRASEVRFRVNGDLWDFPFASAAEGAFEVRARLHDVALDYAPAHVLPADGVPWPALERVNAELLIDRHRLEIRQADGQVSGQPTLRALQVHAVIDDYMADAPQLRVQGTVRGPGEEALRFVRRSPLSVLTAGALDRAQASGTLEVGLELRIPLDDAHSARVRGQVRFAGNDVQVQPDTPLLQGVRGSLDFTETGFEMRGASARVLGGELRFGGGMTRRDGAALVRFQGQGQVTAEGLAASPDWPWARWLGRQASGSARYTLQLGFGPQGTELRLDSDLRGLALSLPAPLAKPADSAWPLQVEIEPLPAPSAGTTRDRLRLALDTGAPIGPLRAEYERQHAGTQTNVLRGRLALGTEGPDWPATGVAAALRLSELDMDAWAQRIADPPGGAPAAATAPTVWLGATGGGYWPTQLGLSAQRVVWEGRRFDGVSLGGTRDGASWRLSLAARQFDGYVEYRGGAQERLLARLAYLQIPPSAQAELERLASQPRSMPALDVVVESFELGDRPLGRLEITASNREARQGAETVREWRLQALRLTVPEARLSAAGNWAPATSLTAPGQAAAARRTALQLRLDIDDAGALLQRFGYAGVVRGGRGRLEGALGWLGSPLALHTPTLSGELTLDVQRGQFLKADPGIAKLLGVLSLQSLPRRLTLDFRDVFSEGFAFDLLRGDVRIVRGVASTRNLQMRGVAAAVLIEGSADLVRETQDLTAVVIPELNAGTASLLAAAVNPVTGLGTLIAQWLLREPLQAAATQTFRISGPWVDPQVERIARTIEPSAASGAEDRQERTP
ncbi:YhdP family protein [Tepidimonas sp.]|uniref:YhdP family protein n=1 Tax=Tepidimonas sp. TaxID=2002775 RepID=UPI002FDFBAA3